MSVGHLSPLASLLLAIVNSEVWHRLGIPVYKPRIHERPKASYEYSWNRGFRPRRASVHMRRKKYHLMNPVSSSEAGAWKHWEFKEEEFMDAPQESEDLPDLPQKDHRAAVKALSPFISEDLLEEMEQVLSHRTGEVRIALEDPCNPSNAWAILRSIDSFGVQYVDVIQNEGPDNAYEKKKRRQIKAAMAASKWLDISLHQSTTDYVKRLKKAGWCIVATDLSPSSVPINELDLSALGPTAMVLGTERDGISNSMKQLADHFVHLPMYGFAESFSVSVGCAVLLSHMNVCGALRHGTLPQSEKDRLMYEWVAQSANSSRIILQRAGFNTSQAIPQTDRFFGDLSDKRTDAKREGTQIL